MSRRTTLQHTLVAALAASVVFASPGIAKPVDRIDRLDNSTPPTPHQDLRGEHATDPAPPGSRPHQDLRGEHATDPAPPGSTRFQPGQPTWATHPAPIPRPAAEPASPAPASGGDDDDNVWLILGIGLAASGIVAGSAAGVARRYRVRARRVAV
jgi:hypothetical protein